MDISKADIEEIRGKAEGTPFALFTSGNAGLTFNCLYSALNEYKPDHEVSIYQLKALQRLIGKKLDLFTSSLQKELAEEDHKLAVVLNWEGLKRQVIIIDLASPSVSESTTLKIEEIKKFIQEKIIT